MPKNSRTEVTEKCQKIKGLRSQKNAKKSKVHDQRKMPKIKVHGPKKCQTIKGLRSQKMPKNQGSAVTEKCHKIKGQRS